VATESSLTFWGSSVELSQHWLGIVVLAVMTTHTEIRKSAARIDMAAARREGEIAICGTTVGPAFLSYSEKVYTLTTPCGEESKVLAQGKASVVLPVLTKLYVIVTCED
jgi:hypothetical protein